MKPTKQIELATTFEQRLFNRPRKNMTLPDIVIITLTIFAESAGEPIAGKMAIGQVITTRAEQRNLTPAQVCLEPEQFSCWNRGYEAVCADYRSGKFVKNPVDAEAFDVCLQVARRVVAGELRGSKWNHFYNPKKCTPSWAPFLQDTVQIGNHVFGRL
jgi:spore germination cell wall hydrolase CwlJ-like protein